MGARLFPWGGGDARRTETETTPLRPTVRVGLQDQRRGPGGSPGGERLGCREGGRLTGDGWGARHGMEGALGDGSAGPGVEAEAARWEWVSGGRKDRVRGRPGATAGPWEAD